MSWLELRVPPLLVALVVSGLMWLISAVTPSLAVPLTYRVVVAVVFLAATLVLVGSALALFWRAGTSVDPRDPGRSGRLVTQGIYRLTRNPMYVAMLFALWGVAVMLSNVFSLASSALFVVYMNRFQITPEERVLASRFGHDYERYRATVRRWV